MPESDNDRLIDPDIRRVHAEDVCRARLLVDQAIAQASTAWVPANAILEALMNAAVDLSGGPSALQTMFGEPSKNRLN